MLRLFLGLYIVLAIGFAIASQTVEHVFTAVMDDITVAYHREAVRGPAHTLAELLRPLDGPGRE